VFDPIDGTRGYISGTPTWGVLISVGDDSGPLMGMIDQPYIGERFMGGFGVAALEGPQGQRELATRATSTLADAIILTTFPEVGRPSDRRGFEAVASKAKLTRFGMDCYGYALIASGQVDLVIEAGLNIYDIHAPVAVITAAGGIVTDWQGGPAHNGGRVLGRRVCDYAGPREYAPPFVPDVDARRAGRAGCAALWVVANALSDLGALWPRGDVYICADRLG